MARMHKKSHNNTSMDRDIDDTFNTATASPSKDLTNEGLFGLGMLEPKFQSLVDTDEETTVPLVIAYGYYRPTSEAGTSEIHAVRASLFASKLLTTMKGLGYANTTTTAQIRRYFDIVSDLMILHHFVSELLALNKASKRNTAMPLNGLVTSAINGQMIAIHRDVKILLEGMPYVQRWYDQYLKSFSITRSTANVASSTIMFGPKTVQPGINKVLSANDLSDMMYKIMDSFKNDSKMVEIAQTLPLSTLKIQDVSFDTIPFNQQTVNNFLNIPYSDGIVTQPKVDNNVNYTFVFEGNLTIDGMLTTASDSSVILVPQSTVWFPKMSGPESNVTVMAIEDEGFHVDVFDDSNTYYAAGPIWEASALVEPAISRSMVKTATSYDSVSRHVASLFFDDLNL